MASSGAALGAAVISLAVPGLAADVTIHTVPWSATNPSVPHDTFAKKRITLKATTNVEGPNITATWDFGDQTPPATFTVADRYNVSAMHV